MRKAKSEAKNVAKEMSKRSDEVDKAAGRTEVSGTKVRMRARLRVLRRC